MIASTTNEIGGYRIFRHLGLARGVAVRSRSVVGNCFGGLQMIFGCRLPVYAALAEMAREEAFNACAGALRKAEPTPSSECAATPTKQWTARPKSLHMGLRFSWRPLELRLSLHGIKQKGLLGREKML